MLRAAGGMTIAQADARYVLKAGDTMGPLVIQAASPALTLTVTGATNSMLFGRNGSATTYNGISLNGVLTDAGNLGFFGGGGIDGQLIVQSVSTGEITFRTAGARTQFQVLPTATSTRWPVVTGSNGANPRVGVSAGNLVLGTGAALATTATDGYVMISSAAGTPTGVPANAGAGQVPMIYDTSANKIWFYNGSWRGVLVA